MRTRGACPGRVVTSVIAVTALTGALAVGQAVAAQGGEPTVVSRGALTDLSTTSPSPLDGASAQATLASSAAGATATLHVWGVALSAAGTAFGAHLHTGPCVEDSGSSAGGHYNADVVAGTTPVEISEQTEVWLDFTVSSSGRGSATTVVPFTPVPGSRSIVIHAMPTDHATGTAGARLACLPVAW